MQGDEKVRNCGGCNKNVYNISAISKKQAEKLLSKAEMPCLHIVRKSDGTVVTDECPEWLKPFSKTWKRCVGIALSILAIVLPTHGAKADQPATPRDMNMFQTEPTVIDGHPYGGRGRAERHKTPEAVPQFQEVDGIPIDPRHYKVPIGSKIWRDWYVKYCWPAPIARIGMNEEDLPVLDKTTADRIFGFDQFALKPLVINEKLLPASVDVTAWRKFEDARRLHAEACLHFAHERMWQCSSSCQDTNRCYNIALETLGASAHDPAFRQFVQSEKSKIEQLERQSEAFLKDEEKPKK